MEIESWPGLSVGKYFKVARCSSVLGYGMDWLAQCHDNVTEWGYQVIVLAALSPSGAD